MSARTMLHASPAASFQTSSFVFSANLLSKCGPVNFLKATFGACLLHHPIPFLHFRPHPVPCLRFLPPQIKLFVSSLFRLHPLSPLSQSGLVPSSLSSISSIQTNPSRPSLSPASFRPCATSTSFPLHPFLFHVPGRSTTTHDLRRWQQRCRA